MSKQKMSGRPITKEMVNALKTSLELGTKVKMIDLVEKKSKGAVNEKIGVVKEKYPTYFVIVYDVRGNKLRATVRYNDVLMENPTAFIM